jgi:uncharacterized protein with GYD domain
MYLGTPASSRTASRVKQEGRISQLSPPVALYWTQGRYDLAGIFEGPDEETANAMFLAIGMNGAVRTETLRAFTAEEVQRITDKLP